MKGILITTCALVALAYAGSFIEFWRLPFQKGDPFTYHDVYRKLKKVTSYEEDMLQERREGELREKERIFRKGK